MARYRVVLLALVLVMLPATLSAQARFTISGFGGVYIPGADLFDEQDVNAVLRFGHKTAPAFGGRVAVWPTPRLAIEAEGAFLPSDIEFRGTILGTINADTTLSSSAIAASINVLYAVIKPPLEPLAIYISGGLGIISRSGDLFDVLESSVNEAPSKTDVAGVAGIGLTYGVARGFNLRVDLRDYISAYQPFSGDDSKLQNDLMLSGGLEVVIGGN